MNHDDMNLLIEGNLISRAQRCDRLAGAMKFKELMRVRYRFVKLLPTLIALASLLASTMSASAQVTVFNDNFSSGSTVNSLSPIAPTANSTSYEVIASKSWSPNPSTLTSSDLKFGIVSTSGGGVDLQALFATTPVELLAAGNYVELTVVFTATAGVLTTDTQLGVGLFNASGVAPWGGGLNNSANNTNFNAATGGAQNWQGYLAQFGYPGGVSGNSQFSFRPAQVNGDNRNQITDVNGSTIYGFQNSTTIGSSSAGPNVSLTVGGRYTKVVNITRLGDGSLQLTASLYTNNTSGALLTSISATTSTSPTTTTFDAFSIGWRSKANAASTMDLRSVKVVKFIQSPCVSAQFVNTTPMLIGQTNSFVNISLPTNATADGPLTVDLVSTNPAVAYPTGSPGGTRTLTFLQNSPYSSTNVSITSVAAGTTQFYLTNATPPACIASPSASSVINVISNAPPPPTPLAFPGAEGFGANATGGRGGDVYYVTNLNDSGSGSLRNGITSASGPRTIVFAVSGNILLQSILTINKPNITIAGQTAPGDGICLRDYSLNIGGTHDTIVRCLRLRRGDVIVRATGQPTGSTGLDTVSIDDSSNVIFDHCSLSWSCDEIFGIVQNQNVTVQWCTIFEPLGDPVLHPYGASHAYGLNCSATTLSIHHNLVARYVFRGPQFEPNDAVAGQGYENWMEAVNNVLYDYSSSGSRYRSGVEVGVSTIPFRFHFLNNFYIRGPGHSGAPEIEVDTQYASVNTIKVHVKGNIGPSRLNDSADEWAGVWTQTDIPIRSAAADVQSQMSDVPLFTPPVPVTTTVASNAYKQVISFAGYNNVRDSVDVRAISNVLNRVYGSYLHSQSEVGGWPDLFTYNAPTDIDRDGMPDYWETANGMNPAVANNNHTNADGYTDLEQYLSWLAGLHAVGSANGFVDVNLGSYIAGMASNATCTVSNPTNGTVTLLGDGRTARFTPTPDFYGRTGFRFVATDALAGGNLTNTVALLITPQPRFVNVSASGGQVVMSGSGGVTNGNYFLLTTTNVTLPAASWSRIATNQFTASGSFNLTNILNPNMPQTFYRLQLP